MNIQRFAAPLVFSALLGSVPLLAAPPVTEGSTCTLQESSLHGAWEAGGGKAQVLFQGDEVILRKNGALSVAKVLRREPCKLFVRYQGLKATWSVLPGTAGNLELKADEPLSLRPLERVPSDLDINLPTLPKPGPVPPPEAKAVEKELLSRVKNDQDALKDPAQKAKRPEIMADNLRYLRDLTHRVGWIDIPRFGKSAASAAILIAKHGSDLLLMKAALPVVERDVKENGGSGEMFSVLYDELAITLGNQQRYGTQFDTDKEGRPYILPLENLSKVDQYRKEIGILSFEDYQKLVSSNLGGVALRVAGSDE
jgi:hypothetical protein